MVYVIVHRWADSEKSCSSKQAKLSKVNMDGGIESLVALWRVSDPREGRREVGNNASVLALISVAGE